MTRRRPTARRSIPSATRPTKPAQPCGHRLLVPVDCCARCVCGRDTHEAMGFMARVVPDGVELPQLAFLATGLDVLGPIDCPCGRQIDVIWQDL